MKRIIYISFAPLRGFFQAPKRFAPRRLNSAVGGSLKKPRPSAPGIDF